MSSSDMEIITVNFKAGQASPGDVGQVEEHGLDPQQVAEELNRKTARLKGFEVSARIYVYPRSREYYIEVVPPNITDLLLKKANAKAPSGDPIHQKIGNLSIEDIIHVAIGKKSELLTLDLKKAVKTVLGTARAIGLTVEGKDPKEVTREVEQGVYDEVFAKYQEEWENA